MLKCANCFEIWQQCCQDACQISKRLENSTQISYHLGFAKFYYITSLHMIVKWSPGAGSKLPNIVFHYRLLVRLLFFMIDKHCLIYSILSSFWLPALTLWQPFPIYTQDTNLAPIPPTMFQSNDKFDQNLQCSGLKYTLLITTKFCTCHDSHTVVTCTKFCCNRLNIFQIGALHILIEFRIWSK